MLKRLHTAAFAACLGLASAMVAIAGSKGLGAQVDPRLDFWTLEAMHLAFLLSFGPALLGALRGREAWAAVAYGVPVAAFLAALAAAVYGKTLPAPALMLFDVYLIAASAVRLASPGEPEAPGGTDYRDVSPAAAYELLNTGGVVLVCTRGDDGRYDLAPIAWSCPLDYEPTSRVLIVMDPAHQTVINLEATRSFALALPTFRQRELVERTGSVSGKEKDKYAEFKIDATAGTELDVRIPTAVAGHLECRVVETRRIGSVAVIAGEVVYARAVPEAWKLRLHFAGESRYYRPLL